MPVYAKVVRDRIPEIIERTGKKRTVSKVTGEMLILALQEKLIEELREFDEGGRDLEELADILEVVDGLASSWLVV
jgi:predicted house-cleaning noncanonical NTP pyrophosphatase (MazG superfamily)